jgi:cation diffusion facilitator family transporter
LALPGKGDARKVVLAAMIGNGLIAIAKFVAAFFSGSITMLAEGVHSVADTANQALLLLGMGLSKREDRELYPLGRAKESYFWAFIVALMLFFLGGVFATYEGIHKLMQTGEAPGSQLVPVIVLSLSIVFEAGSFLVAYREFQKARGDTPLKEALFGGKDPTIPLVLLEDTGAMLGLVIALVAVTTTWVTGSPIADGVGSIVIGVLLCVIGVVLAHDTRSLLIGESATPSMRRRALELASETDGVEAVTQLISMHLGPDTVLLALKVRFRQGMTIREAEGVINALEARIRGELPQMKRIFVEPDGDWAEQAAPAQAG